MNVFCGGGKPTEEGWWRSVVFLGGEWIAKLHGNEINPYVEKLPLHAWSNKIIT